LKVSQLYDLFRLRTSDLWFVIVVTGDKGEVDGQEAKLYGIAGAFGGIPGGETNGERGYILTFVIAYIRVSDLRRSDL
jgi:hypothetical protein